MAEMISSPDILVVDAHRDIADMFVELFRFTDLRARAAYNVADALTVARDCQPDVVFIGMDMPGVNCCALANALREQSAVPPYLIALTTADDPVMATRASAAVFDRKLAKPSSTDAIMALLDDHTRAWLARRGRS